MKNSITFDYGKRLRKGSDTVSQKIGGLATKYWIIKWLHNSYLIAQYFVASSQTLMRNL